MRPASHAAIDRPGGLSARADRGAHRAFAAFNKGEIHRYYLPGVHAMNILMTNVLGGGGVASILNDPQGKAYGQRLLNRMVEIPADLIAD